MLRYFSAAFWASPRIPGLGAFPFNVVAVVCVGILGALVNPGFWLLGTGLEALYLFGLAFNPRFQKVCDALDQRQSAGNSEMTRQQLLDQLSAEERQRYGKLLGKVGKIRQIQQTAGRDDLMIEGNLEALERLLSAFVKLLVAHNHLCQTENLQATEGQLRKSIESLERELKSANLTQTMRESKQATLGINQKRLMILARKDQTREEVDSDLERIEAQIDLALENALSQGRPVAISAHIELASHLLDQDAYYGASETVMTQVKSLDAAPAETITGNQPMKESA